MKENVHFLAHWIVQGQLRTNKQKVLAIWDWENPTMVSELVIPWACQLLSLLFCGLLHTSNPNRHAEQQPLVGLDLSMRWGIQGPQVGGNREPNTATTWLQSLIRGANWWLELCHRWCPHARWAPHRLWQTQAQEHQAIVHCRGESDNYCCALLRTWWHYLVRSEFAVWTDNIATNYF